MELDLLGAGEAHHRVQLLEGKGIVRLTRLAHSYQSTSEVEDSFNRIHLALQRIPSRHRRWLLVDTRQARARNDSEFEKVMAPQRRRIQGVFQRVAVLVQSEAGRMQVNRYAREDAALLRAFTVEKEALEWLQDTSIESL